MTSISDPFTDEELDQMESFLELYDALVPFLSQIAIDIDVVTTDDNVPDNALKAVEWVTENAPVLLYATVSRVLGQNERVREAR